MEKLFADRIFRQVHNLTLNSLQACILINTVGLHTGGPKSKPQPNDPKIVLNAIKACQ